MLDSALRRIEATVGEQATLLDVGGWAKPLARADWVLDLMPYETRGAYGLLGSGPERCDAARWIQRDICDREPFPFGDDEIDFVVCSHTLEDIRDPIWVCSEMSRVAKAGYVEVPSRLEEQTWGVNGSWVGWSHHRWLVSEIDGGLEFLAKPHMIHGTDGVSRERGSLEGTAPEQRVLSLFWEGRLHAHERFIFDPAEHLAYVAEAAQAAGATVTHPSPSPRGRMASRLRRRAARAFHSR